MEAVHKILDERLSPANARNQLKPTSYSTIAAGKNSAPKNTRAQQPPIVTPTTSATPNKHSTAGNPQPETHNKNRKIKTNLTKDNTILLVPTTVETNTYQELRLVKDMQPRKIIRHIPFPSGACLITCKNKEDAEEITELIKDHPKMSVKGQKHRAQEVRIHGIPNDYSD